jgi:hypothetical protein
MQPFASKGAPRPPEPMMDRDPKPRKSHRRPPSLVGEARTDRGQRPGVAVVNRLCDSPSSRARAVAVRRRPAFRSHAGGFLAPAEQRLFGRAFTVAMHFSHVLLPPPVTVVLAMATNFHATVGHGPAVYGRMPLQGFGRLLARPGHTTRPAVVRVATPYDRWLVFLLLRSSTSVRSCLGVEQ